MTSFDGKFTSVADKKFVCSFLHTIYNNDVFINKKFNATHKLLIKLFIELDILWVASDQRIMLASKGIRALQDIMNAFVDFEPKDIKFQYTRYE